jgi:hypothetical protein
MIVSLGDMVSINLQGCLVDKRVSKAPSFLVLSNISSSFYFAEMFLDPIMILHLLTPIIYLALSILTFHFALHSPFQTTRYFFLPPFLLFAILSLTSSKTWLWTPGLTSLWTQAMVLNIPHIICVLYIRKWPAQPGLGGFRNKFKSTWRLWGNPQLIGLNRDDAGTSASYSLPIFLLVRLAKLPLYYFLNTTLLPALVIHMFGSLNPEDFAPPSQILFRRIHSVSTRELLIRAYISMYWIWQSIIYLDGSNAILSVFFVGTGIDRPCDWPPLFGNPMRITSLRTFWNHFWHRIAVGPYTCIGRAVANTFGLRYKSVESNVLIAFIVFGLSGVSHGVVSWRIGRDGWTDVWWFMLNFVACAAETAILKCTSHSKELQWVRKSLVGKIVGRVWVFVFLFWSVPKWQYPAMYRDAVQARQLAAFEVIFSRMKAKS